MTQPNSTLKNLLKAITKNYGGGEIKPYEYDGDADIYTMTDKAVNRALGVVNESLRNPGPRKVKPAQTPKKVKPKQSHFRGADTDDLHIRIVSDGTLTEVTLHPIDKYSGVPNLNEHVARGVSKRRKGETRSNTLGVSLAMARAFAMAAERYEAMAEKELDR